MQAVGVQLENARTESAIDADRSCRIGHFGALIGRESAQNFPDIIGIAAASPNELDGHQDSYLFFFVEEAPDNVFKEKS